MDRSKFLKDLVSTDVWDIIIIGGGASGLGAALDSAQRGYKTLCLKKMILPKEHLQEARN